MPDSASVTCHDCRKRLAHDQRYCPLFPDVQPPTVYDHEHYRASGEVRRVPGEKWGRCVCLIHTCFRARESTNA